MAVPGDRPPCACECHQRDYPVEHVPTKQPYRCPVCGGRGAVPNGFYGQSEGTNDQTCRACSGRGVVIA